MSISSALIKPLTALLTVVGVTYGIGYGTISKGNLIEEKEKVSNTHLSSNKEQSLDPKQSLQQIPSLTEKNSSSESIEIVQEDYLSETESSPKEVNKNYSKDNWFSIQLDESDVLERNEWTNVECPLTEEEEGLIVLKCPWSYTRTPTTISFFISPSFNPDLMGKNWTDLTELHFTPKREDIVELGFIFSDDSSREIILPLKKKSLQS